MDNLFERVNDLLYEKHQRNQYIGPKLVEVHGFRVDWLDDNCDEPVIVFHSLNDLAEVKSYEKTLIDARFDVTFVEETHENEKKYFLRIYD